MVPYGTVGRTPLKSAPSRDDLNPLRINGSLSPHPKRHVDRFSRFPQHTVECPHTLQCAATFLFPLKLPLQMGDPQHAHSAAESAKVGATEIIRFGCRVSISTVHG